MEALRTHQAPTPGFRTCTRCKQPTVCTTLVFKMCLKCRQKRRKVASQSLLGEGASTDTALLGPSMKVGVVMDAGADENRRGVKETGMSGHAGVKRKAEKSLSELGEGEQAFALKMMKKRLKTAIQKNEKNPTPLREINTNGIEYQTATALYSALRSKLFTLSSALSSKSTSHGNNNKLLQFEASHAIIAVSTISNLKRAQLVSNDLRKIARLPFDLETASSPNAMNSSTQILSFTCTCQAAFSAVAPSLSATTPTLTPVLKPTLKTKGTQGDLIRWARAHARLPAAKGSPSRSPGAACGGRVIVVVSDDVSHPVVGIPGQRIVVRVEHP
ncbi:hypothetical protein B0H34DRAFT_726633 [Crassisporium funariophilum]|nr:hypothetical protein B0H34DRAFT_726633 [Crassisporium funariophilum]